MPPLAISNVNVNAAMAASVCPQATPGTLAVGSRVRLHSLTSARLNGAFGVVVREEGMPQQPGSTQTGPASTPGAGKRLPVRLQSPPSCLKSHPGGVRVRPANLDPLPLGAAAAVVLYNSAVFPALAFNVAHEVQAQGSKWRRCPVPEMLGIPLVMLSLAQVWESGSESMAVYLLADTKTGVWSHKL